MKRLSFPPLFQPSPFSLSFSLSAAQKTSRQPVPRRPVSPLPARSGPAPPPPSLSRCQGGPACRGRLPPPSEQDSRSNPTGISAPPCSLGPHAKAVLRPYISTPRPPLEPHRTEAAASANPSCAAAFEVPPEHGSTLRRRSVAPPPLSSPPGASHQGGDALRSFFFLYLAFSRAH